jgi:hypothetical protein
MKTFIKFVLLLTGFILSLFPTMVAFICLLNGKAAMLEFISGIHPEKFWLLSIPLFMVTMTASVYTLMEMLYFSAPSKARQPLSVDDPDLGRKLKTLYN